MGRGVHRGKEKLEERRLEKLFLVKLDVKRIIHSNGQSS